MRVFLKGLLIVAFLLLCAHGLYSGVRVKANRQGGRLRMLVPTWEREGLDATGLVYRRRHLAAVLLGVLVGLILLFLQ